MTGDDMKQAAALAALKLIEPGMTLGLGTGSTAEKFVAALGEEVARGLNVLCVPTSEATRRQAEALNIQLSTLDDTPQLDLTIDGADEIDGELTLIKGGGGALLREKIVAQSSAAMVVIADDTKLVDTLGAYDLPVEVTRFGAASTALRMAAAFKAAGCQGEVRLRTANNKPFITDNGNVIYDCALGAIPDTAALAAELANTAGVVDHGLFITMCDTAILGGRDGVRTITRG